jgi:transcriptional regulator with XRE-family HTH domain
MRNGLSQSDIARKLKISRQAVNQLTQTIPEKVASALQDASKLNGIEPRYIDSTRGILLGWSRDFQTEVVVTLSLEAGLRVWYRHNLGQCKICPDRRQCRSALLRSVDDLGVLLTRQERELNPSKLSSLIFSRALGRADKKKPQSFELDKVA